MEETDTYDITPDKSLMKKLGMAGYRTSQALAELVDNSIDARIPDERQEIAVRLDFKGIRIIVEDNGAGMDVRELTDAMTIAKEPQNSSNERLGQFGIGMKSACSALGRRFEITTSKGDGTEYHTKYDEKEWLSDEQGQWNLGITATVDENEGEEEDGRWHGTKITISNLSVPLYPNQVSILKENFGIRYSPYLESGQIALSVNTVHCRPAEQDIEPGSAIKLKVPLNFGGEITGHLALLKKRSIRGNYGLHLFWKGRLIKAFAKFGFRAHPENAKIVGSVNLDHVPVNYTKTGFLEESSEYLDSIKKLASSEQLRTMLRRSAATAGASMPSIKSIFDHVVAGTDDGYEMHTRVSAELSMKSIASTKPFAVRCGEHERVDVRVEHKEPSAPLYVADIVEEEGGDSTTRVSINANSDAFRFVKNPLFLIGMIASESKLLTSHPEMAGLLDERSREMAGLLSRWLYNTSGSMSPALREERWRRSYSLAESGSYKLSPELIEAHDILVDRHEFKFQFTALSTLSPYMHDLGGKLVYTVHTIPPHGEGIVDLLADSMGEEFAVADRPSTATIETLLRMPHIRRVLAVREYAQITGSTIAAPAKAFVDLMMESSAHGVLMLDAIGLRRILKNILRLGTVDLEDVRMYARASKCTKKLDWLLQKEAL